WREFERFSTTVVSAYLEPVVSDYLIGLQGKLASVGFGGTLLMMLANGLVQPPRQCLGRAVYLLGSGPAAAPSSAIYFGSEVGSKDLISLDMGGTSLDVCVVRNAEVPSTTDAWVGDHRVAIKMVDIHSVGAGGGSIGWVDSLGLLRVGPDSAGADPGPACYGVGSEATVTDADVVLGYIPVDYFLGGEITLSMESARNALERLGEPLKMNTEVVAQAVYDTANSYMADQVTEVCTRRGLDVRDFTLVVGGGAGPVHAAAIAKQLGLHNVIVPTVAALYSAFGMLTMDLGRDYSRSFVARADDIDSEAVDLLFREMEQEALESLHAMDIPQDSITLQRTAEMRYLGQYHEVEVPVTSGKITTETIKDAVNELHRKHELLYTFSMPWLSAEFLTFRLRASSSPSRFSLRSVTTGTSKVPETAKRRERKCQWNGEWIDTPVFDGNKLLAGNKIQGPAIIEDQTTTTVVPQGCECIVDASKNYLLHL
ncbi:MAG: hydantoinase/oxoprolinase family protein, partial [Acidimicrobiaceae bacterium]|nr:hydantoinase/oxoprolinase family protein [Acidimicrobiaceae bacterium]